MKLELRFFATFREAVGQRDIEKEYDGDRTVGEVLNDLSEEYPDLEFFDEEGELREYLSIMRNGRDITFLDALETPLGDGDKLSIFPPVAGGCSESVVRSFRGISLRAARHYLSRIGGTPIDEKTVEGEDWRATMSTARVKIGPSLTLTEVEVQFEGTCGAIDEIVDEFAMKAMRAGG